jgi:hypothetical protein
MIEKKKKILSDHKQRGKILVPPFIDSMGTLQEISWVRTILPELLWIALLQNHYTSHKGVELVTSLARVARKCSLSDRPQVFCAISEYSKLTIEEKKKVRSELVINDTLVPIQAALEPLIRFYPECPLEFLFPNETASVIQQAEKLDDFKALVAELFDREQKTTMMVQATAVWLAFDSGKLKVAEGLALAKFPEIEKYPNTELSQQVAASIRCTVLPLVGTEECVKSSPWPKYFWNRGLKIDSCHFRITPDE